MTTTNTAALDTVIEHATETTKAAGERVREFAQIGVRKATEGFEQISKAAQTALLAARSPIEALDVSAKYWRGRLETRFAQAQDLGAFVRKSADDVVRPVQERIEKFTRIAA